MPIHEGLRRGVLRSSHSPRSYSEGCPHVPVRISLGTVHMKPIIPYGGLHLSVVLAHRTGPMGVARPPYRWGFSKASQ